MQHSQPVVGGGDGGKAAKAATGKAASGKAAKAASGKADKGGGKAARAASGKADKAASGKAASGDGKADKGGSKLVGALTGKAVLVPASVFPDDPPPSGLTGWKGAALGAAAPWLVLPTVLPAVSTVPVWSSAQAR